MLPLSHRIAFALFVVLTLSLGARGFYRLYRRILRGRKDVEPRLHKPVARLWYAFWTTLLQTRVFRKRRGLGVFHAFIFYAFVLYLLVNAVDAADGYLALQPLRSPFLMAIYGLLTDAFSVLAIIGVIAFVLRRFLIPSRADFRFGERTLLQPGVRQGYIKRDSAIVSAFILLHIGSRIVANSARLSLVGADRWQPFGSALSPLFARHAMAWRIAGYWGALGSVLLFLLYFPYSKHIHLFMAPLKYFFRRDAGSGELPTSKIDLEVAEPEIGAARLADLSWPRLLDAYACIQCNRCQDVCPASQTGKSLSPAALEINKRMVLNTIAGEVSAFSIVGASTWEKGDSGGPSLLEAVISPEAVWACTTCGACMQVCPTQDEQMLDIIDIRRNLVMAEGSFPAQLQTAFRGMERASNPWGSAREKRMEWAEGLDVPTIDQVPDPDVLYWVGCAASYDASAQKTARATVQLLTEAKVSFAVLGKKECCTGDSARRAGNELLYQEMATAAVSVLNQAKPRTVLASCPHCVNTIATEYPRFGGNFKVVHHTEYLAQLVDEGRLTPLGDQSKLTFHDPCYLGRHRGTYAAPRSVLHVLSQNYVELPRNRDNAFCCGAGGAQFWKEEETGTERIADNRFREVQATLAEGEGTRTLAVGCPFCKSMLASTPAAADATIQIKDVAELLWEGVQRGKGLLPVESGVTAMPLPSIEPVVQKIAPAPVSSGLLESTVPEKQPDLLPSIADQSNAHAKTERKKWTPKVSATQAEQNLTTVNPSPKAEAPLIVPAEEVGAKTTEPRKKWQPKGGK